MTNQPEELPVIFRAERTKDAEVTAVFPTLPWTRHDFTVYAHIGQHGAGSWAWYQRTRAAKPEEYADLLAELHDIYGRSHSPGDPVYRLKVYRRITTQHRQAFKADADRMLKSGVLS